MLLFITLGTTLFSLKNIITYYIPLIFIIVCTDFKDDLFLFKGWNIIHKFLNPHTFYLLTCRQKLQEICTLWKLFLLINQVKVIFTIAISERIIIYVRIVFIQTVFVWNCWFLFNYFKESYLHNKSLLDFNKLFQNIVGEFQKWWWNYFIL